MNEQVVTFGTGRSLVGILHEPACPRIDLPVVVLLNAGILHRVGPNRLYVTIARRLVELGFTVLRFDVWGIGDSQDHDGPSESNKTFIDDTLEAFKMLRERVAAKRFLVMGICMGAQIALAVANRDERVVGLVLMEGIYIKSMRYHVARMLAPQKWMRVVTGRSHMVQQLRGSLIRRFRKVLGARPTMNVVPPATKTKLNLFFDKNRERNMKETLRELLARGAQILLVFRDGNEIAYNYRLRRTGDEIVALGLPRALEVAFIPFADHTFTPLVSQDLLVKAMHRWIVQRHETALPARA